MVVSLVRFEYTDLKHGFIIFHLLLITLSLVIYKELAKIKRYSFFAKSLVILLTPIALK